MADGQRQSYILSIDCWDFFLIYFHFTGLDNAWVRKIIATFSNLSPLPYLAQDSICLRLQTHFIIISGGYVFDCVFLYSTRVHNFHSETYRLNPTNPFATSILRTSLGSTFYASKTVTWPGSVVWCFLHISFVWSLQSLLECLFGFTSHLSLRVKQRLVFWYVLSLKS